MNNPLRYPRTRRLARWLLLAGLTGPVASQAAENMVRNGSFESTGRSGPRFWQQQTWGGSGEFAVAESGRTGERSAQISSTEGGDLSWSITVPAEPFGRYRLSAWIKTDGLKAGTGRGALLNLHNLQGVATEAVTGTTDWKQVSVEFDVDDLDSLQINCLLGGWGQATGTAWFDDVELTRLSARPAPTPALVIDAGKIGEPMPVEIYSQFIEHLGRCVYGGIWAEMLEDRKFYHPITADYAPYRSLRNSDFPVVGASPWQIQGPADRVTMSSEAPFVGKHTPRITAGAGIRQLDLGVTAGKDYVGYLWMQAGGDRSAYVRLTHGDENGADESMEVEVLPGDYQRHPFRFTASSTTDKAWVGLQVTRGTVLVGTASLMPADNIDGLRADTLELLRQLKAPIYRWPGGNFVSGYDWRDGVGDRDRRPPRTNPAWTGVEHNDFGMHEFIHFCELVDAEPWITVNTGFGDAYSAAAELEYANGPADSPQGRRRAANGHPEPYGVKFWGVGNEMY
ncbi:MAG: carbohydrate binding domain-containing protein, partial [Verrucomicrobiae bacterium]|nr:carbohydrate binding domain-containing protein [Verrucomicrobiae bacterium]